MKFEAILFDCDGVLVDSEPITNGVLCTMLNEAGWAISAQDCMEIFIGKTVRSEAARIEAHTGQPLTDAWMAQFYARRNAELQARLQPIAGAVDAVRAVHALLGGRIACASGGVAFGKIKVDQRPVLYLALEDGWRRLQSRFRQINPGDYQPKSLDLIIDAVGQVDVELKMSAWLDQHRGQAGLIILDTLGRIKPPKQPGEESYLADYAVGVRLKSIIDQHPGSSLLVVHHTRKQASDDFVDGVSGTQGLAGSFDSVLVLARRRQASDAVLHITGRDVEEGEYALQTDAGVWSLIGDSLNAAAEVAYAGTAGGRVRVLDFGLSQDAAQAQVPVGVVSSSR